MQLAEYLPAVHTPTMSYWLGFLIDGKVYARTKAREKEYKTATGWALVIFFTNPNEDKDA